MANLAQTGFSIDDWQVNPSESVLKRKDEVVHLEPKVMDVLVYFASRPGDVITREELERDVWKGALVGYDAVTKTIIKLRKALQDDARSPRYIATISKKGYQLITPVSFSTGTTPSAQTAHASQLANTYHVKRNVSLLGLVLLILIGVYWLAPMQDEPVKKELPIVLVLPFENRGDHDKHDMFVDGITEDVITDLSKISNLLVLASHASFQYKGKQVNPQQLRKDHKVDYVLQGSIRRLEKTLRVNVQVVDTETNTNIWAERYDRNVDDVFLVQNELTHRFVNEIALKLTRHDEQQLMSKVTTNIQAYDHFLSGQRLSRQQTKESNEQAREAYQRAIKIDPSYSRAYGAIAYTMALDYLRGWTDTPVETLDRALTMAEQATLLDANIPQTFWVLGYVRLMRKEYEDARKAVTKAISIAPNYADGYGLLALIYNSLGKPQEAIEYVRKGMQLNPYYTWDYPYNLGRANYLLGNYDKAITALEKAQARNENAVPIKLFLTASYIKAGRTEDAEWTAEQLQMINPNTTISHTDKTIPMANTKLKKSFLDDLRKSGLPE